MTNTFVLSLKNSLEKKDNYQNHKQKLKFKKGLVYGQQRYVSIYLSEILDLTLAQIDLSGLVYISLGDQLWTSSLEVLV